MVHTIRTSALALCLMMATSSMGTPVDIVPSPIDIVPGPVMTYLPGSTVVDTLGNILQCILSSPPIRLPAPNPDTSCGNAGLAYAVQKHNFYNSDAPKYSNADVEFFKTATPIQTDITKRIGFNTANLAEKYSIYGGALITVDMIAVNHRGYFVPQTTGEYTISSQAADDLAIVWIGDNAYNGKYTRANANFEQGYYPDGRTQSYKITLQAGIWYPFRVLFVAAQGAANLAITVTAPDGSILISPTSIDAPYFVQYDCDKPSTKFQEFGKETA